MLGFKSLLQRQQISRRKAAKRLVVIGLTAVFLLLVAAPIVLAQDTYGLDTAGQINLPQTDLRVVIARVIQIFLGLLGIIAVIIVMYGGFVWMTASGDSGKVDKAKDILKNGLIGLIIILSAFVIVSFIIRALTGSWVPGGGPIPGGPDDWGRAGLGGGPIASVYPASGQDEVPINTYIAVTFKEEIKLNTICEQVINGQCCAEVQNNRCVRGSKMKNVAICQLGSDHLCQANGDFAANAFSDSTVMNRAGNAKTFVFTPNKYLGLEDQQDRDFQVTLQSGIERASDSRSVFTGRTSQQYLWSFTTNGELDLDPPEIVSINAALNPPGITAVSGVYPNPDDTKDDYTVSAQPTATRFVFSLSGSGSIVSHVEAAYRQPVKQGSTAIDATLSGEYGGRSSGTVTVTMSSDAKNATVDWPVGMDDFTAVYNNGQTINIGPYGLVFNLSGQPLPGSSWTFTVTAKVAGDQLEILRSGAVIKTYYFGTDIVNDASVIANIKAKILADSGAVFESCGKSCITTKETGGASAKYTLRSSSAKIDLVKTAGADATENQAPRDQKDQPKNTIIQINFNEAVNPIFVDDIIVKYGKSNGTAADTAVSNVLAEVSNQYRTVELRGGEECGVNSCGSKIYCWPVNDLIKANPDDLAHKATNFAVEVPAAPLMASSDSRCGQWRGTNDAKNRCAKAIGSEMVFYPAADGASQVGVRDMAANSFNGSFNSYQENGKTLGISEGQSGSGDGHSGNGFYNLNTENYTPTNKSGDNFLWSFYLSDKIDKQSPLVNRLDPAGLGRQGDEETEDLVSPVTLNFDRIMRSSTLKPGWNYGTAEAERRTRYLALASLTAQNPVGYWILNSGVDSNRDTWPDFTQIGISHNRFDQSVTYGPLAGSGLQSITQNCFLPSGGPANAGSGSCLYNGEESTVGCVDVALPNPASYAKLKCSQIADAKTCTADQICKVWFYDSAKPETNLAGSWVLTNDQSRRSDTQNSTGCCFGKCVDK